MADVVFLYPACGSMGLDEPNQSVPAVPGSDDERRRLDITATEERLRSFAEYLPGVIYSYDRYPDGRRECVFMGPGFEEIVGPRHAGAIERDINTLFELIHPTDRERLSMAVEAGIEDRQIVDIELRILDDEEQWRWVRSVSRPLVLDDGRIRWHIVVLDIAQRERAERELRAYAEHQRHLIRELDHRVGNNLSALLTLVNATGRYSNDLPSYIAAIRSRVSSMVTAHRVISANEWRPVPIRTLITDLCPHQLPGAIELLGPDVQIPTAIVSKLAIVLNELMSNSEKHGALAVESGVTTIEWAVTDDQLHLIWTETGGPPCDMALTPSYGTSIMRGIVETDLRGRLDLSYARSGVRHQLRIPFTVDDTIRALDDEHDQSRANP